MKIWECGEKTKAVCESCSDVVHATFEIRDVPFGTVGLVARNIMVASCDLCENVVAVPPQSGAAIREARSAGVLETPRDEPSDDYNGMDVETWKAALRADILDRFGPTPTTLVSITEPSW